MAPITFKEIPPFPKRILFQRIFVYLAILKSVKGVLPPPFSMDKYKHISTKLFQYFNSVFQKHIYVGNTSILQIV